LNNGRALGLIEAIGLTPAAAALDAAIKAAEVKCIGVEKVIGVNKEISVTIALQGEVAAVQAAVEAGQEAGSKVGNVISTRVIPAPHGDVQKLVGLFRQKKAAKIGAGAKAENADKSEPKVETKVETMVEESTSADAKKK
jgi:ethanolamine utilization protein EutM